VGGLVMEVVLYYTLFLHILIASLCTIRTAIDIFCPYTALPLNPSTIEPQC
jgi:hypothetical protein